MIGLALLLATTQARVTLQYYQGIFLISDGPFIFAAPTKSESKPQDFVRFRRGDTYTVWDKRGLAIRSGHWIYETRFKELAVSPKLFSKDAIVDTVAKVKRGERSLEASAVSGALRLGTDAFFVPRWIDKKGYTWLEALVRIDLASEHPKPVLIGKFPGVSLANGTIDRRLFALNEEPAMVVRKNGEWGVSWFDALSGDFTYTHIGERLRAYSQLDGTNIAYLEAEDDGLTRVGIANVASGSRTDAIEDRGSVRILDAYRPPCAIVTAPDRLTIRNLQSGSAMDLVPGAGIERTAQGVLVWWPKEEPKHAALLDADRWDRLAVWEAPPAPKTEVDIKPAAEVGKKPSSTRSKRPLHHSSNRQSRAEQSAKQPSAKNPIRSPVSTRGG